MTLTDIFKHLGAPLTNSRWSWGAVRPADNAVFLRVWQDEVKKFPEGRFARITAMASFQGHEDNLGYAERNRHVRLIRDGAPSYMIMCVASDVAAAPRTIAQFNEREVFVGGRIQQSEGEWWLELVARKPIQAIRI